jgi:hypothetical protein
VNVVRSGKMHDLDIEPARYLNLALGGWVLVSAFLWRHSEAQFLVTIAAGSVLVIVAPFELGSRLVRKIGMVAGSLLALGAIVLPRSTWLTFWHNLIFGLIIAGISFFGPPHGILHPRPPAPDDAYEGTGGV